MSDDPLDRIKTEIAFIGIVREESKRLVLCHPDEADRISGLLSEWDVMSLYEVRPSQFVPIGQIFVVDENALDASFRESLQRSIHNWSW